MSITTYQIRNVLKTYGNQLKRRTGLPKGSVVPIQPSPDSVDISIEARKKQVLSQLSAKLISQVATKENHQESANKGAHGNHEMDDESR